MKLKDLRKSFWHTHLQVSILLLFLPFSASRYHATVLSGNVPFNGAPPLLNTWSRPPIATKRPKLLHYSYAKYQFLSADKCLLDNALPTPSIEVTRRLRFVLLWTICKCPRMSQHMFLFYSPAGIHNPTTVGIQLHRWLGKPLWPVNIPANSSFHMYILYLIEYWHS